MINLLRAQQLKRDFHRRASVAEFEFTVQACQGEGRLSIEEARVLSGKFSPQAREYLSEHCLCLELLRQEESDRLLTVSPVENVLQISLACLEQHSAQWITWRILDYCECEKALMDLDSSPEEIFAANLLAEYAVLERLQSRVKQMAQEGPCEDIRCELEVAAKASADRQWFYRAYKKDYVSMQTDGLTIAILKGINDEQMLEMIFGQAYQILEGYVLAQRKLPIDAPRLVIDPYIEAKMPEAQSGQVPATQDLDRGRQAEEFKPSLSNPLKDPLSIFPALALEEKFSHYASKDLKVTRYSGQCLNPDFSPQEAGRNMRIDGFGLDPASFTTFILCDKSDSELLAFSFAHIGTTIYFKIWVSPELRRKRLASIWFDEIIEPYFKTLGAEELVSFWTCLERNPYPHFLDRRGFIIKYFPQDKYLFLVHEIARKKLYPVSGRAAIGPLCLGMVFMLWWPKIIAAWRRFWQRVSLWGTSPNVRQERPGEGVFPTYPLMHEKATPKEASECRVSVFDRISEKIASLEEQVAALNREEYKLILERAPPIAQNLLASEDLGAYENLVREIAVTNNIEILPNVPLCRNLLIASLTETAKYDPNPSRKAQIEKALFQIAEKLPVTFDFITHNILAIIFARGGGFPAWADQNKSRLVYNQTHDDSLVSWIGTLCHEAMHIFLYKVNCAISAGAIGETIAGHYEYLVQKALGYEVKKYDEAPNRKHWGPAQDELCYRVRPWFVSDLQFKQAVKKIERKRKYLLELMHARKLQLEATRANIRVIRDLDSDSVDSDVFLGVHRNKKKNSQALSKKTSRAPAIGPLCLAFVFMFWWPKINKQALYASIRQTLGHAINTLTRILKKFFPKISTIKGLAKAPTILFLTLPLNLGDTLGGGDEFGLVMLSGLLVSLLFFIIVLTIVPYISYCLRLHKFCNLRDINLMLALGSDNFSALITLNDSRAIPFLIGKLRSGDAVKIVDALRRLGATNEQIVDAWLKVLERAEEDRKKDYLGRIEFYDIGPVFINCAKDLGGLGDPRAIVPLLNAAEIIYHKDQFEALISALLYLGATEDQLFTAGLSFFNAHHYFGTDATGLTLDLPKRFEKLGKALAVRILSAVVTSEETNPEALDASLQAQGATKEQLIEAYCILYGHPFESPRRESSEKWEREDLRAWRRAANRKLRRLARTRITSLQASHEEWVNGYILALSNPAPFVRMRAILGLWRLEDERTIEPLIKVAREAQIKASNLKKNCRLEYPTVPRKHFRDKIALQAIENEARVCLLAIKLLERFNNVRSSVFFRELLQEDIQRSWRFADFSLLSALAAQGEPDAKKEVEAVQLLFVKLREHGLPTSYTAREVVPAIRKATCSLQELGLAVSMGIRLIDSDIPSCDILEVGVPIARANVSPERFNLNLAMLERGERIWVEDPLVRSVTWPSPEEEHRVHREFIRMILGPIIRWAATLEEAEEALKKILQKNKIQPAFDHWSEETVISICGGDHVNYELQFEHHHDYAGDTLELRGAEKLAAKHKFLERIRLNSPAVGPLCLAFVFMFWWPRIKAAWQKFWQKEVVPYEGALVPLAHRPLLIIGWLVGPLIWLMRKLYFSDRLIAFILGTAEESLWCILAYKLILLTKAFTGGPLFIYYGCLLFPLAVLGVHILSKSVYYLVNGKLETRPWGWQDVKDIYTVSLIMRLVHWYYLYMLSQTPFAALGALAVTSLFHGFYDAFLTNGKSPLCIPGARDSYPPSDNIKSSVLLYSVAATQATLAEAASPSTTIESSLLKYLYSVFSGATKIFPHFRRFVATEGLDAKLKIQGYPNLELLLRQILWEPLANICDALPSGIRELADKVSICQSLKTRTAAYRQVQDYINAVRKIQEVTKLYYGDCGISLKNLGEEWLLAIVEEILTFYQAQVALRMSDQDPGLWILTFRNPGTIKEPVLAQKLEVLETQAQLGKVWMLQPRSPGYEASPELVVENENTMPLIDLRRDHMIKISPQKRGKEWKKILELLKGHKDELLLVMGASLKQQGKSVAGGKGIGLGVIRSYLRDIGGDLLVAWGDDFVTVTVKLPAQQIVEPVTVADRQTDAAAPILFEQEGYSMKLERLAQASLDPVVLYAAKRGNFTLALIDRDAFVSGKAFMRKGNIPGEVFSGLAPGRYSVRNPQSEEVYGSYNQAQLIAQGLPFAFTGFSILELTLELWVEAPSSTSPDVSQAEGKSALGSSAKMSSGPAIGPLCLAFVFMLWWPKIVAAWQRFWQRRAATQGKPHEKNPISAVHESIAERKVTTPGPAEIVLNGEVVSLDTMRQAAQEMLESESRFIFNAKIEGNRLLLAWSNDPAVLHDSISLAVHKSQETFASFKHPDGNFFLLPEIHESLEFKPEEVSRDYHNRCIAMAQTLIYCGFPAGLALHYDMKNALTQSLLFDAPAPQTLGELAGRTAIEQPSSACSHCEVCLVQAAPQKPRVERKVSVGTEKGIHTTPSVIISSLAQKINGEFGVAIGITRLDNNRSISAHILLDLMSLGATQGTRLLLSAEGDYPLEKLDGVLDVFQEIISRERWPAEAFSLATRHERIAALYFDEVKGLLEAGFLGTPSIFAGFSPEQSSQTLRMQIGSAAIGSVSGMFECFCGPSSSHTAGANRIGNVAREMIERHISQIGEIRSVEVRLYNSFAMTGIGHQTPQALTAGILGRPMDDPNLKSAMSESGIVMVRDGKNIVGRYEGTISLDGHNDIPFILEGDTEEEPSHPNTAMIFVCGPERRIKITGESLGAAKAEVCASLETLDGKYLKELEPRQRYQPFKATSGKTHDFGNAFELLESARKNKVRVIDLILAR
ncbi:MAG: serine dehydratase beta chain, partial [Candidatus Omnitrophica bacterium]|nr:serine dehydratase beta chain [Candidatus Omnitrophota bacterium]